MFDWWFRFGNEHLEILCMAQLHGSTSMRSAAMDDELETVVYELESDSGSVAAERSTTETEIEEDPLPADWRANKSKYTKVYHGGGFFFMAHDLSHPKQKELFKDMATRKCMSRFKI